MEQIIAPTEGLFKGAFYRRGDEGYEEARVGRVFNHRRPGRMPAAVLFAQDEDDVVAAVRWAREQGLKIAIRSGGHSWAAWSVRDDALLLDLSPMRELVLDHEMGIVRVSPAVQGGAELDPFLAEHGLMFNGGHCPTVGVGGFLLQGGMGWNCRGWGWACENLVAIDVVTANGELVRADATQHADLYWAARGAGPGFFGVVTRFHLQTRPRPKALTQSTYIYPMEVCDQVLRWAQEIHGTIDPSVEVVVVGLTMPLPPELDYDGPVLVVDGVAMVDSHAAGVAALAPLESCPALDRALVRRVAEPTTFAELRQIQLRQNPEGHRYAADNAWLTGPPELVVPALHDAFATLPNAKTFALWFSMAPLRELPDMALSLQTEIYFALYVIWEDEADDERYRGWLAAQMKRLAPISAGLYLGDSDFTVRPARFVSDAAWRRLEEIRARYDPDGRFHSYLSAPDTPLNANL